MSVRISVGLTSGGHVPEFPETRSWIGPDRDQAILWLQRESVVVLMGSDGACGLLPTAGPASLLAGALPEHLGELDSPGDAPPMGGGCCVVFVGEQAAAFLREGLQIPDQRTQPGMPPAILLALDRVGEAESPPAVHGPSELFPQQFEGPDLPLGICNPFRAGELCDPALEILHELLVRSTLLFRCSFQCPLACYERFVVISQGEVRLRDGVVYPRDPAWQTLGLGDFECTSGDSETLGLSTKLLTVWSDKLPGQAAQTGTVCREALPVRLDFPVGGSVSAARESSLQATDPILQTVQPG